MRKSKEKIMKDDNFIDWYTYTMFRGKIDNLSTFELYRAEAITFIKSQTFSRISEIESCYYPTVHALTFKLIELFSQSSTNVTSESVGGWSVSYESDFAKKEAIRLTKMFLADITTKEGIPVLYIGCIK